MKAIVKRMRGFAPEFLFLTGLGLLLLSMYMYSLTCGIVGTGVSFLVLSFMVGGD